MPNQPYTNREQFLEKYDMLQRADQINRIFKWACWIAIGTGISHLIGHTLPMPLSNPTEAHIIDLMTGYQKQIAGGKMSMMDVQNGLSLCYSLFFLLTGLTGLQIVAIVPMPVLAKISVLYCVGFLVGLLVSLFYFFWLPSLCFATLAIVHGMVVKLIQDHVKRTQRP